MWRIKKNRFRGTIVILSLLCNISLCAYSQQLTVESINEFINPQHRNNIGSWALGEKLHVKGTYSKETATNVQLRLITFAEGTWTNPLMLHNIDLETEVPFSGIIDASLTIPDDYILGVTEGEDANMQMLQVRVSFNDNTSQIFNFYLTIIAERTTQQNLVDFDEIYGAVSGSSLANKITEVISSMSDGDTIVFKSAEYDFEASSITIAKSITLSGSLPVNSTSDEKGAYDVKTVFKNLKGYKINASNVNTENIELSADASTGYVFTRISHSTSNKYYTGLVFKNVIFRNGRVQCFGGNGAGVKFTNTSFIAFTQGGYYLNRNESIDAAPQFNMSKCFFNPLKEAINFNVRAISLDAGNTEYPVVWNQSNSTIDNCLLDGTGLGISSKCCYVNVTNCHFKGYRMDVDMIHIEEFGHHFLIDGNTFEHVSPARGINIDREIQPCHDITITNNKWIGQYGWIISAHSPYNLVMENNDFSESWAKNTNDKTIDFTYDHGEETYFTEYNLPTNNIVFRNNTGLDNDKHGFFAYKALAHDASIEIEYPKSKIQVLTIDEAPQSIINTAKYYRIRNKNTGDYLHTTEGQAELEFSSDPKTDSCDIWEFTFEFPYFYFIKNRGTKQYMNVYRGYTMGDYNNDTKEQILVEQTDFFNNKKEKPRWYLRKHIEKGSTFYEILPGGNERKSRNVQIGNKMELEFAKIENKEQLPPEDDSSWEFIPVKSDVSIKSELQKSIRIFPNPASTSINIEINTILKGAQNLSVLDSTGTLIHQQTVEPDTPSLTLNVDHYPVGIYLIKLGNNENLFNSKLVIN